MARAQRVVQVDAFADAPFTGNPAGVCVLAGPGDQAWMQAVAPELNLPATAFLWREEGSVVSRSSASTRRRREVEAVRGRLRPSTVARS